MASKPFSVRRNRRTGRYDVPVPVAGTGRRKWIPTGATTREEAERIVAESGVERLVHLANANALTAEAVSIVTAGRRITCAEVFDGWKAETAGRWTPGTERIYRQHVAAFLYFANCHRSTLSSVTRETLGRFVNRDGAKLSTRKGRLAAVSSLYAYARAKNFILEDTSALVFIRKGAMTIDQLEPRPVFPLEPAEFQAIMDSNASAFWKAVTSIAYWTGLRFSDCVALEWASITDDFLIVWTKKRGKRVMLPLDDTLLGGGALRALFATIPRSDPTYLFPKERLECLAGRRSKYPTAFAEILRRLGIGFKSFHSARHAAATRLAVAGKTLEEIGTVLAHSSEETTKGYVHA